MGIGAAVGLGLGVLGIGSSIVQGVGASKAAGTQARAADRAAQAQAQATQGARRFQREGVALATGSLEQARGDITAGTAQAREDLLGRIASIEEPFSGFSSGGLRAFRAQLDETLDPDSAVVARHRGASTKHLARQLSAKGGLGSGLFVSGLAEIEARIQAQRFAQLGQLSNIGFGAAQGVSNIRGTQASNLSNLALQQGQSLAANRTNLAQLQGNLGNLQAGTTLQGANQLNQLRLQAANASAQGTIGIGNAITGGIGNLATLGLLAQGGFFNNPNTQTTAPPGSLPRQPLGGSGGGALGDFINPFTGVPTRRFQGA